MQYLCQIDVSFKIIVTQVMGLLNERIMLDILENQDEWLWERIRKSKEMIGIELLMAHKEYLRSYSYIS